ncbi:MAG: lysylphosphatidylglycerol synthase transmembrane domain-containing protein [Candidatus Omnitrophota bacterium]|jgi:hypothetical protein
MKIFKKFLSVAFRISISLVLLIFLFKQVDRKSLIDILRNVDVPMLFVALGIFALNYLLCFYRWDMLLRTSGIIVPVWRVIVAYSGGIFFSLFLPTSIGGDFVRSVDLAVHTKKPSEVVATVILDRLSGFIGLVTLALAALFLGWDFMQNNTILIAVAVLALILVSVLLVMFNNFCYSKTNSFLSSVRLGSKQGQAGNIGSRISAMLGKLKELLTQTHTEIHLFRRHKRVILINIAISILIQTISPITFYLIALSLGIKINILYFFVFLPVIGAITLIPVSIGGLGIRDAATIFFFAQAGVSKYLAFAMSLVSFFFIIVYASIGGLVYVFAVRNRRV